MPPQWTSRLAEYGDDDDERQMFRVEDSRHRTIILDTPLQFGILGVAVAALVGLGLMALL